MLPTLELQENSWIVLDSVAGSDMLNYGLYFGFGVLCVVVEGHINSIKVAKQLKVLTDKQGLKLHFVLNKYNPDNELIREFQTQYNDLILGQVPTDVAVIDYNYQAISNTTKESLDRLIINIQKLPIETNQYERLRIFEEAKI
jgi:CO dehydrogenase nickel-insertion accessory protein CooC1